MLVYLEKESAEREEKLNKVKVLAVKARKELDSSRKEVTYVDLILKSFLAL